MFRSGRFLSIAYSIASVLYLGLVSYGNEVGVWLTPLMTLALIFLTGQAVVGLAWGALMGSMALAHLEIGVGLKEWISSHFFGSLDGPWKVSAILFTLFLGAFAGVLQEGGGFRALSRKLLRGKSGEKKRVEFATFTLGGICFFDGLANGLLVGKVMKPLFDQAQIPRARLAYIVDSSSSAVACIAFISTWIAAQLSLIQEGLEGVETEVSAYELFFRSIPLNFYCLLTLLMVAIVIWRQWDFGPMAKSGHHLGDEKVTVSSERVVPVRVALVPLGVMISSIMLFFYFWETTDPARFTWGKLAQAFGGSAGPYALTMGSLIGLLVAIVMNWPRGKGRVFKAAHEGAAQMLGPLGVLVLAWTFSSVLKELGTAQWLAERLVGSLPVAFLPLIIFLVGALTSFVTGSSWGTFGLLMPLAMASSLAATQQDVSALPIVIAAVFSGAVFGDHCSPFSDTTIVSSFSSGVSTHEHVKTQLPYALLTALVSAGCGFGLVALGQHPVAALFISAAVLVALPLLDQGRKNRSSGSD